ncbi:hypothetical protein LPB86_12660 [Pedobacter sp. MC2016-14]|uniref:hypothetical protein n=1 Tax=Pedobacter sp. MC2016-14 TaxID=2897327 RepID=UPI001E612DD5|nr:hypothetical protein [Pedobacter sp. MC2016-14]MCD0489084.1 hypothetical protein [Pedobacter sp. MC2016-14]
MRLILINTLLLLCAFCHAQETFKVGKDGTMKLPNGAVRKIDLALKAKYMESFGSEAVVDKILPINYEIGTMKLTLSSGTNVRKSEFIIPSKKRLDNLNRKKGQSDYRSYITNVSAGEVLITYSNLGARHAYSFQLVNKSHENTSILGSLRFYPADNDKALKMVEAMLNSITLEK